MFDDFEPCEPPSLPTFDVYKIFPPPYWNPDIQVSERNIAFTSRVLNDFNLQWRHILRNRYNDFTFRRVARAILLIVTFDFKIVAVTTSRQGTRGVLVGPLDQPAWVPLESQIVRASRGWVVVSQDPVDCVSLIREHMASQQKQILKQSVESRIYYLVLTIRHITICCAYKNNTLEWTHAERFLNGLTPLSDRAIALLLWITSPKPPRSLIQRLPLEIQDRIIRYVSQGPVEVAKVGCVPGLGSPFQWMDGRMAIGRERVHRCWVLFTPLLSRRFGLVTT